MARIRTIKPEFFTSDDIVSLSPLARLLYIALWCEADKEGRLSWRPKTLKMRYLPGDDCNIFILCDEILSAGLVVLYGDGLAHIPGFAKHQHINPRETKSTFPEPPARGAKAMGGFQEVEPVDEHAQDDFAEDVAPCHSEIDASILELHAQVGREGKGREGNTRR